MRRLAIALLAAAGCDDFASPAELEAPRIIALVVEPAALAPGQEGRLIAVVAGPGGLVDARAHWSLETPSDDVDLWSASGIDAVTVAAGAAEATIELRAEVDVAGVTLAGIRSLAIGGASRANPAIELTVDGALAGAAITAPAGSDLELAIVATPPAGDEAGVSWFSTAGEIELYRRSPAILEAPAEPGPGVLLAVFRDGLGGVAWRQWQVDFR